MSPVRNEAPEQKTSSYKREERVPLLSAPSARRHSTKTLNDPFSLLVFISRKIPLTPNLGQLSFHSSDVSCFFNNIMEKVKPTRFAHFMSKLAVDSEPGLTNAQLMLDNHDLKPGEESCWKISRLVVPMLIKCCS